VTPKKPKHVRFWGNRREGGGARRKRELTPFANDHTDLAALGAEVVAISSDGLESHAELARRLGIPFPLASDPDLAVARAFGVADEDSRRAKRAVFVVGAMAGCSTPTRLQPQ